MPALGCLIPFVLLIVGAAIGGAIGGTRPAIWGGVAGFAIGLLCALVALRLFERAKNSLPE
jgi:tellurite resistance protein TehA-like permease